MSTETVESTLDSETKVGISSILFDYKCDFGKVAWLLTFLFEVNCDSFNFQPEPVIAIISSSNVI